MENNDNKNERLENAKNTSIKTLAVFGLIALLAVLSFGIIKVAPTVIRTIATAAVSLSSVFIPAEDFVVESSRYNVSTGEPFTVSWDREGTDEGSYTISYPCIDGVHIEAAQPGRSDVVFCNTQYRFLNNGDRISLMAFIDGANGAQAVDLPITVSFTENGSSSVTSKATVTVNVSNTPFTSGTPTGSVIGTGSTATGTGTTGSQTGSGNTGTGNTGTTPVPSRGTQTNNQYPLPGTVVYPTSPTGRPDLVAQIIETGIISTSTNTFVAKSLLSPQDRGAVRFQVINIGNKASGSWTFAAVLPTFPDHIFQSDSQQSLAPGDRIEFTLGYDSVKRQAENTITINVDPISSVQESNEDNNIIKGKIFMNI